MLNTSASSGSERVPLWSPNFYRSMASSRWGRSQDLWPAASSMRRPSGVGKCAPVVGAGKKRVVAMVNPATVANEGSGAVQPATLGPHPSICAGPLIPFNDGWGQAPPVLRDATVRELRNRSSQLKLL